MRGGFYNRAQVFLFVILFTIVLWKVYTNDTDEKVRHLRNAIQDIERVQRYTSSKLELISNGLDKLTRLNHTKLELRGIQNLKSSLSSISFPGKS